VESLNLDTRTTICKCGCGREIPYSGRGRPRGHFSPECLIKIDKAKDHEYNKKYYLKKLQAKRRIPKHEATCPESGKTFLTHRAKYYNRKYEQRANSRWRYWKDVRYDKELIEKHKKYAKKLYDKRKTDGICVLCGKEDAVNNWVHCSMCHDRIRRIVDNRK